MAFFSVCPFSGLIERNNSRGGSLFLPIVVVGLVSPLWVSREHQSDPSDHHLNRRPVHYCGGRCCWCCFLFPFCRNQERKSIFYDSSPFSLSVSHLTKSKESITYNGSGGIGGSNNNRFIISRQRTNHHVVG